MTTRTVAQHLASRANLRQRHTTPLSERGQQIVEQVCAGRVELTPTTAVHYEWGGAEKGRGEDGQK